MCNNVYLVQSNESTLPLNAYVRGCTNLPCVVPQLETLSIEILFRSPRPIESMVTEAYAYLFGPIGIKYDLGPAGDTCSSVRCPVPEDQILSYRMDMFIEPWIPVGTSVSAEFVIRDKSDSSPIVCIRLPIRIAAPNNQLTQQSSPSVIVVNA